MDAKKVLQSWFQRSKYLISVVFSKHWPTHAYTKDLFYSFLL